MKRYAPQLILIGLGIMGHALAYSCLPTIKEDIQPHNGIVILPGYQHAVAICGLAEEGYSDAVIIWRGNHTLYVNPGHILDSEVDELSKWATKQCNKLR